jgi:hypothetical protein
MDGKDILPTTAFVVRVPHTADKLSPLPIGDSATTAIPMRQATKNEPIRCVLPSVRDNL